MPCRRSDPWTLGLPTACTASGAAPGTVVDVKSAEHGDVRDVDGLAEPLGGAGPAATASRDFESFAHQMLPDLLRYAAALTGDPHLGADLVQDVLVRAQERWGRIRETDRPDRYVKKMLTNEHLSFRRRWHARSVVLTGDESLHVRTPATPDFAAQVVDRDDLRQQLATLPRRQRAVLVLRFYEGLDDAEIGELLGMRPGTVRSNASRALAALRRSAPDQPR